MYQLYYYPYNASMAPHLVLEEMQAEFELVLVDRAVQAHKSSDYLALNPTGKIPTLVDGEQVILETAAICLYLCDQNPGTTLIPAVNDPDRGQFYQWLMYLTNTMQAEMIVYFYPERYTTKPAMAGSIKAKHESRLTDMFELLDKELANKRFLVGQQVTVCDYYLFMMSIWADEFAKPPLSWPHLSRYLRELSQRPAVQRVCAKEGINLSEYK